MCLKNTVVEGITMDPSAPKTLYVSTFASVFKTTGDYVKHGTCNPHPGGDGRDSMESIR
jgi:hypothetical protein